MVPSSYMGEFSDGYRIAEELHALRDLIVEHLDHPGAHPSAFAAHGASPGVVDDAERTAAAIISNAGGRARERCGECGGHGASRRRCRHRINR